MCACNLFIHLFHFISSFDLELPVDCDDEYWDHPDPKQRFKQPENKPSLISAFILFIKLNQILSYCLRTIVKSILIVISRQLTEHYIIVFLQYAINKSKILFGYVGHNWEQHIVAELDSALNKWVDSVPDHRKCTFGEIVVHILRFFFFFFQCDGIPLEKMKTSSTNRRLVTHFIIIFKFLSTGHSFRLPTNHHLFLSLLWLFAQTLRDRVAMLLRFRDEEFVSLHYIPMSVDGATVQLDELLLKSI